MIESLWYGIFAALAFIGFIAIVYWSLIHIFRSDDRVICLYYIDDGFEVKDLQNLISRTNVINTFLCNNFGEIVLVNDKNSETDLIKETKSLIDDFKNLTLIESDQLVDYIKGKRRHGTGIY